MSCLVLARSAIREEHKRKLEHLSVSKAAPTKRLLGKSNPGRAYGLPPIPWWLWWRDAPVMCIQSVSVEQPAHINSKTAQWIRFGLSTFQLCKSAETPVQRGALWKNGFRLPLNIYNYKSTLTQHSHWRHWRNTGKFEHDLNTLKPCVVLKSCLQFWNSHSPPFINPLYIKLWSVVNLFLSIFHVAK